MVQAVGRAAADGDRVHPGVLGYLRWNALSVPDNLVLDDPDETIAELQALQPPAVARSSTSRSRAWAGGSRSCRGSRARAA